MRVFLDANVLFSASNPGSNIEKLIAWIFKQAVAVSSDLAITEARRNILAKRAQWILSFEKIVSKIDQIDSVSFALPAKLAEKDIPLLCSAIRSKCDYFVTGDKRDFEHLFGRQVQGVHIVSLLQMADVLAEKFGNGS
ncbi:MAG: hypothetical protein JWM99_5115 [Verrucomicrobiales bacterium]|nr:hypothetical protein [Verrucomicrobiales bacterium]